MLIQHLHPLASSLFSLLAIASLLLSFVMLGSRWLRKYLYAFAAESWVIAGLSAVVGFYGGFPELYLVALLTLLVTVGIGRAFSKPNQPPSGRD